MSKHTGPDFGDISEDQSPEAIAEQVEAATQTVRPQDHDSPYDDDPGFWYEVSAPGK